MFTTLNTFTYRGMDCEVKQSNRNITLIGQNVNGYLTGHINVDSYDRADEVAEAHGGFTYFDVQDDGRVTLGFDTAHYGDGPDTQNEAYVTQAIKAAVDSLYDAGLVREAQVPS